MNNTQEDHVEPKSKIDSIAPDEKDTLRKGDLFKWGVMLVFGFLVCLSALVALITPAQFRLFTLGYLWLLVVGLVVFIALLSTIMWIVKWGIRKVFHGVSDTCADALSKQISEKELSPSVLDTSDQIRPIFSPVRFCALLIGAAILGGLLWLSYIYACREHLAYIAFLAAAFGLALILNLFVPTHSENTLFMHILSWIGGGASLFLSWKAGMFRYLGFVDTGTMLGLLPVILGVGVGIGLGKIIDNLRVLKRCVPPKEDAMGKENHNTKSESQESQD